MKNKRFYQIETADRVADINIYGDITAWEWLDSDVSAHSIKTEIDGLDVDSINVYINSYGGEVAEALAIYSALKRHSAKVHTYCDGFACSAASIVFCAGDERTMGELGMLMIHNCMSYLGYVNSGEMRKAAEDNDKINSRSIEAYVKATGLDEAEIVQMMNDTTWLTAQEALDKGFATDIAESGDSGEPVQSAQGIVRQAILDSGEGRLEALCDKLSGVVEKLERAAQSEPEPEPGKPTNSYQKKFINFFKNLS